MTVFSDGRIGSGSQKWVKTGQRWDAGVGDSGGQPGSNAKARRSPALDQPCETRVSMGVRLGAK
jgi:hypothetical protein